MIPVIHETREAYGISIFKTTDQKFGVGFELEACDLESDDREAYCAKLIGIIRSLDPRALSRIQVVTKTSHDELPNSSRAKSVSEIGYTKRSLRLFVEVRSEPKVIQLLRHSFSKGQFDKDLEALVTVYDQLKQSGLKVKPIAKDEIKQSFPDPKHEWVKAPSYVSDGIEKIGLIRLTKPTSDQIDETTLAKCLRALPKPFEVSVSLSRLDQTRVKLDLERRLKQSSAKNDNPTDQALQESTIETIKNAVKHGSQFVQYEFIVIIKRSSEEALSSSLKLAKNILAPLGDCKIETFGAAPTWLATQPTNSMHVPLKELDDVIPLLLPVWHFGETHPKQISARSLLLHREDDSVHSFDLFDPDFNVFNSVVIGTSGKGKSVLAGLLTQSLLNDPSVSIIKIDVGGSHSKECELFGGQEFVMQLGKPSGVNPFSIVGIPEISDSEKIGILSRFLSVLILEQSETSFSKELRAKIETCVQSYLENHGVPSLQDFYDRETNFPRRNLLRRWTAGGLYQSAFSSVEFQDSGLPNPEQSARLRYFNFSQVFQASDPEFAQAGIAAVLARFNTESLIKDGRRIVLICDETPFFIRTCFDFFKFTTANVRKFGHAVILITQTSGDLVVNDDTGILENSPQRFLFSVDGDHETYKARFGLTQKQLSEIKALKSIPGKESQVYLQTKDTGRQIRIKITPSEYWTLTSSEPDRQKLSNLREAIPNLSLKEAIQCLSLS